jgi:hypothetical protein
LTPRYGRGKLRRPGGPATLADEVRRWVKGGPAAAGLDRANWAYAELADHLYKATGVIARLE